MKDVEKIVIPEGKLSTMYYCRDCRHLDRGDVTKDGEASWCEKTRHYRCFDKDYGCSYWER